MVHAGSLHSGRLPERPITPRSLRELEATFLRIVDHKTWECVDSIVEADGISFLCPQCFDDPPVGPVGCHMVICWDPKVDQTHDPKPGRWELRGTGIDDLSLVAGSSSVKINGGCDAHFFVRVGHAVPK